MSKPATKRGMYYSPYKISGWMGDYRACLDDWEAGFIPVGNDFIPADWRVLVKHNPDFPVPESWKKAA